MLIAAFGDGPAEAEALPLNLMSGTHMEEGELIPTSFLTFTSVLWDACGCAHTLIFFSKKC